MPKEMLVPVSVDEFFKWDDLEQIYLCGLEDSASSDKDTAGRETSHTLDFQQDSPGLFSKLSSMERSRHSKSSSSIEEPQEEFALMQLKGEKWFSLPKFGRRRQQYRVESKSPTGKSKSLSPSPTGKSKSLSPSPQSRKAPSSPKSPQSPKLSVINLATITGQVGFPQEVSKCVKFLMHQ